MADDMRTCKYCGRSTSKAANFCWYCARELDARPERPDAPPSSSRLGRWSLIGVAAAALVGLLWIILSPILG